MRGNANRGDGRTQFIQIYLNGNYQASAKPTGGLPFALVIDSMPGLQDREKDRKREQEKDAADRIAEKEEAQALAPLSRSDGHF